jgi:hypothetical protein
LGSSWPQAEHLKTKAFCFFMGGLSINNARPEYKRPVTRARSFTFMFRAHPRLRRDRAIRSNSSPLTGLRDFRFYPLRGFAVRCCFAPGKDGTPFFCCPDTPPFWKKKRK